MKTTKAQIIIDKNGKVLIEDKDIDIRVSINGDYNSNEEKELSNKYASAFKSEVIKVLLNMPNWIPAKCDGKNVKVRKVIPINFRISQ